MIYTEHNLKYMIATRLEPYVEWRDRLGEKGFRTISLSLAGPASEPVYTAVMVKLDEPFRGESWPMLTKQELEKKIDELAKQDKPLHPYVIAATGTGNNVVYAACFRTMTSKPRVKLAMTSSTYADENANQQEAARILLWVDAFGTDDTGYCAIWTDNPERIAWTADTIDEKARRASSGSMR